MHTTIFLCLPVQWNPEVVTYFWAAETSFISQFTAMTLIWAAPPSGRRRQACTLQHKAEQTQNILTTVRCCNKWRRKGPWTQALNASSQPLFFSPLVTVNNLGLRRFIALHSKCSRRIRVLWPSYWSNWEDVQQSKRHSWEPHRMHGIRKASGPLLAYGRLFKLFSRGLLVDIKPPEASFYPSLHVRGLHSIFLCRLT